jgi:hypothetical protein
MKRHFAHALLALALVACASHDESPSDPVAGSGGSGGASTTGPGSGANASSSGGASTSGPGGRSSSGGATASSTGSQGTGGGTGGGPASCGGTPCYVGQDCVGGHCVFADCSGVKVPGDYATVQAAVDATAPGGGTICLGAQAFAEDVTLPYSSEPLTLQGVSPDQSSIQSLSNFFAAGYHGTLVLKGMAVTGYVYLVACGEASFLDCKLVGTMGTPSHPDHDALWVESDLCDFTVTLDGTDVSAPTGSGIIAYADMLHLAVRNSYVHDTMGWGIYAMYSVPSFTIDNNTFEGCGTAFEILSPAAATTSLELFNNLFTGNGMAIKLTQISDLSQGNNAVYANTTNYGGTAVPGAGYVTTDPKLDTTTSPPGLLAGSPCRGAGDGAHAPSTDFWGRPRDAAHIDIGAVQSSP